MIIFLANQFIGSSISSGGDVVFIQILKRINNETTILAPSCIKQNIENLTPLISFVSTDKSVDFQSASSYAGGYHTVLSYLSRAILSYKWLQSNIKPSDTLYLTGDFICNSLPAWLIKQKYFQLNVVSNFYHRNPLPLNRHGNKLIISLFSRLLQTISLKLIRGSVSHTFVLTDEGKKELLRLGYKENSVIITGAGIDRTLITQYSSRKKIKNQLIFIGRLNITKGAFDLINILKVLNRQNHYWHCHIIGQGTDQDINQLKENARFNNLSKQITIHGYVDEKKKYRLLSTSGVMLFPSKEEGYGIVVAEEALSLNVPVVSYDLPVLKSLFGKSNGLTLVPMGNYQKFATAISIQMSNSQADVITMNIPSWDDVYQRQSKYFK